jgi:hypothetical protein
MPAQLIQIITLTADIFLFLFVGYYLFHLHKRERSLHEKEKKIDTNYHHVVDDALAKERQILDDAAREANQIMTGANYVKQGSQERVDHALEKIVTDVQQDSLKTSHTFMQSYQASMNELSVQSLKEFQDIIKGLQTDLQKQVSSFHETLLPALEKELEEYKQMRLKQTEQTVTRVVQKASQDILNKSISLEDHHTLIIQSLEKAKKEGVFN